MTSVPLSRSVEDYLKAIYAIADSGATATTGRIAERLDVAPASVTGMVKRLGALTPALVEREPRAGVHLTREGRSAALRIIRRHRLLEQFLVEVLHYPWDEVHDEAERLEHSVSPVFVERLSVLLGEPAFDPHGDPIPDAHLNVPDLSYVPISNLAPGQGAVVRRIRDGGADLLRYLASVGLRPGAPVAVRSRSEPSGTVEVVVDGTDVTIALAVADTILAEPVGRPVS